MQTLNEVLVDEPGGNGYSSLCLMLIPRAEDIERFYEHAGLEWDDMHTTLFFAGEAKQYVQRGIDVRTVEQAIKPLLHEVSATTGKVTRFDGVTNDHNAVVVLIEQNEEIVALHRAVAEALKPLGITWQSQFSYKPHMTLGYIDVDKQVDLPDLEASPIRYERLRIGFDGDDLDLWLAPRSTMAVKSRAAAFVQETKDLYMGAPGLRPKVSAPRTIVPRGKRGRKGRGPRPTTVRNTTSKD